MEKWLHRDLAVTRAATTMTTGRNVVIYRLRQVREQLGCAAALSTGEFAEVARCLPPAALALFSTMSNADQRHSLRVCRGLQEHGCMDTDMLAAALLHDVGKAQGRVPFWTRPAIVLGKKFAPRLLAWLVVHPSNFEEQNASAGLEPVITCHYLFPEEGADRVHQGCHYISSVSGWRRSLSYAWWHADVGAELAAAVGLTERTVLYIRTHHQPNGPAAELHRVDEVS